MKKKCIILWTDFCQGLMKTVGAGTPNLTNIGYILFVITHLVRLGMENDVFDV
jgi:hypothetical protein